jgi:hypothetical protein
MSSIKGTPIGGLTVLALLAMLTVIAAVPARADDPVFPLGSRIGLVPPPGMEASHTFRGFADPAKNAAILTNALPAAAFAELEKTIATDVLKKQGITVDKREPMKLGFGDGFLVTGKQTGDNERFRKYLLIAPAGDLTVLVSVQIPDKDNSYPDGVIRTALQTLTVRSAVPDDELLSLLPFQVGDLGGFHIDDVIPGRALMLVDRAKDTPPSKFDARLLVAALSGGPAEADDRANFARLAFGEIGGIKDVHITMSEPLRMGGQQGFQTAAQAKDIRTDTDVMVVQWLRFGSGGFLQMIGISRTDNWTDVLNRLRTVRDSIEPR